MGLRQKIPGAGKLLAGIFLILFGILFIAQTGNTSFRSGTMLPQEVLRPQHGEEIRFPQDYVIGKLGRGDAPEESYQFARRLTASLAGGNGNTEGVFFPEQKRLSVLRNISGLGTRSWRVGGGRIEPDGSISFLIRFLGRERSITGELYLRQPETAALEEASFWWEVDDILLEFPRSLSEGKFSPSGADMTPYERFF